MRGNCSINYDIFGYSVEGWQNVDIRCSIFGDGNKNRKNWENNICKGRYMDKKIGGNIILLLLR